MLSTVSSQAGRQYCNAAHVLLKPTQFLLSCIHEQCMSELLHTPTCLSLYLTAYGIPLTQDLDQGIDFKTTHSRQRRRTARLSAYCLMTTKEQTGTIACQAYCCKLTRHAKWTVYNKAGANALQHATETQTASSPGITTSLSAGTGLVEGRGCLVNAGSQKWLPLI